MKTIILAGFSLLLILSLCSIARAQHGMQIERINPEVVGPGYVVDIFGAYLGNYTGTRKVFIALSGANYPPSFFMLNEVNWASDGQVQVRIPPDLPAGDYLLKIENDDSQSRGRSNVRMVRVLNPWSWTDVPLPPPSQSAMIDSLFKEGDMYLIQGRNFGIYQGSGEVTLHRNYGQQFWSQRLDVRQWEDNRIRVRIPAGLDPGEYFVQVNYDASWIWGSNSKELSVPPPAPRTNFMGGMPDLVVSEINFFPQTPVQGNRVEVRVTVYNRGDWPAGPYTVEWRASNSSRQADKRWHQSGLGAGQSENLTHFYIYSRDHTQPSRILTRALIDAYYQVAESDEGNNMGRREITVLRP